MPCGHRKVADKESRKAIVDPDQAGCLPGLHMEQATGLSDPMSRWVAGGAVVLVVATGCQTGIGVSALNRCGRDVQVRSDSVPELTTGWTRIAVGQRHEIGAASESTRRLFVQVRR
jgi:hypothetical protein